MAHGIKTGGRAKGTPNRITAKFKEAVQNVYGDIGGDAAFAEWAKDNQTEFYKIAARLIPQEMRKGEDEDQRVIINIGLPRDLPALPPAIVSRALEAGRERKDT